jgi:type IV secretory pathway VirB10-like protein
MSDWDTSAMRVVLGGIVAAAATTAAWLGLETVLHANLAWMACAVGLVTGLCVHRLAGPHAGASVARGTLAAVLTAAAMTAGIQIVTMLTVRAGPETGRAVPSATPVAKKGQMKPTTPARPKPAKPTEEPTKKPTEKPATDTTSKPTVPPKAKPEVKPDARPAAKPKPKPAAKPAAEPPTKPAPKLAAKPQDGPAASGPVAYIKWWLGSWETLWMGLSTLIAYVLGRGRDRSPSAESGPQTAPS